MSISITILGHEPKKKRGYSSNGNSSGSNLYSTSEKAAVAYKLAESVNLWGQEFDGTSNISGDLKDVGSIFMNGDIIGVHNIKMIDGVITGLDTIGADNAEFKKLKVTELLQAVAAYIRDLSAGDINTEYLEVTKAAHFFELIIDKIKAAGGAVLFTPADGFKVEKVEDVANGKRLYWRAQDPLTGKKNVNMWKVNDQAICQNFNQAVRGTSYDVRSKYFWSLVVEVSEEPVDVNFGTEEQTNTIKCNYITISTETKDGNVDPEVDDEIVMLGHRGTEVARQSAIYIAAYKSIDGDLIAPLFAQYTHINDFDLPKHKTSYIATGVTPQGMSKNLPAVRFYGQLLVESGTDVKSALDTHDNAIDGLGTTTVQLRTDLDSISSTVSSHTSTIDSHTSQISSLVQTANSISSTVSSHTSTINSHTSQISTLEQTANSISSTVSSHTSTLDSHTTQISSLIQTANSISSTVSSHTSTLDSHTSQISSLIQTANGITSTVSETYVTKTDFNETVTTLSSTIQQTATNISATITNGLINTGIDITTGKINLIADTIQCNGSSDRSTWIKLGNQGSYPRGIIGPTRYTAWNSYYDSAIIGAGTKGGFLTLNYGTNYDQISIEYDGNDNPTISLKRGSYSVKFYINNSGKLIFQPHATSIWPTEGTDNISALPAGAIYLRSDSCLGIRR